jgi:hypothetical protein
VACHAAFYATGRYAQTLSSLRARFRDGGSKLRTCSSTTKSLRNDNSEIMLSTLLFITTKLKGLTLAQLLGLHIQSTSWKPHKPPATNPNAVFE